ncbi:MAG: SipW-dependent-type signal peptide-containing protein [Eubacteriales bacterium]|nr:SipW-dependent-type signal peptide-containing protein [Eubacteriales bacterium]
MKNKILLIAVIAICLTVAITGTLAYFTAEETAHNVITTGGVKIALVEKTKDPAGEEIDFPQEGIDGVMPGAEVSKIVSVKNTGQNEAWVRLKVDTQFKAEDGTALSAEIEGVGPALTFSVHEKWNLGADGFYYYKDPLPAGESTDTLFDKVIFAPEIGNAYQNCQADIVVSAQAVQTANNGSNVGEAAGWPEP